MAVTFDSASTGSGTTTPVTVSHTTTSGTTVLVVSLLYRGTITVSGVTFDGTALTNLISVTNTAAAANNNRRNSAIYYMINPPVKTADVVVTASGNNNIHVHSVNVHGSDTTDPFRTPATDNIVGGTSAGGSFTSESTDLGFDHISTRFSVDADVGQTERTEVPESGITSETSTKPSDGTSTTMGWTWDSDTGTTGTTWIGVAIKEAAAGGQTLIADAGSFTLTGQVSALAIGHTASDGTHTTTGQDGVLNTTLTGNTGSFTLTGQDADLVAQIDTILDAEAGSFVLIGQDADLVASGAITLDAEAGSSALIGQDAGLRIGLTSSDGSFAESGQDVTLNTSVTADTGQFDVTGQDADLVAPVSVVMTGETGVFELFGQDADLVRTLDRVDEGAGGGTGRAQDYWDVRAKYLKWLKTQYEVSVKEKFEEDEKTDTKVDLSQEREVARKIESTMLLAEAARNREELRRFAGDVSELFDLYATLRNQRLNDDIIMVLLLDA